MTRMGMVTGMLPIYNQLLISDFQGLRTLTRLIYFFSVFKLLSDLIVINLKKEITTFDETHDYLYDQLPNLEALNIIINRLTTKNQKIWRALVI